jgi:hypothetical protein
VALVLMVLGVGLLSVVTANVAAYMVESGSGGDDGGIQEVNERLARIEAALAELATRDSQAALGAAAGLTERQ